MRRFAEKSRWIELTVNPSAAARTKRSSAQRRNGRAALLASAVAAAASLLLLASCATVPIRSSAEWMGVLPSNATMYLSLDVASSADMIKEVLKKAGPDSKDLAQLVDMSKRLVCAITLIPDEPPRFSVVAMGNYPSVFIGMRLSGNPEWKRKRAEPGAWYWEWEKNSIQMSLPNGSVLLASNEGVELLMGRYVDPIPLRIAPDAAEGMERLDLVLYMPELPGGLSQSANREGSARIPIQEVWLDAAKAEGGYQISGTCNTSSEREAKLLVLVLRLAIVAWMRGEELPDVAARLKTIQVTSEGSQVRLTGLAFSEEELLPLFLSLVKAEAEVPGASEVRFP